MGSVHVRGNFKRYLATALPGAHAQGVAAVAAGSPAVGILDEVSAHYEDER